MGSEDELENTVYTYTTSQSDSELEEENKVLKETVSKLKSQIKKFKKPALLVAEVCEKSKYEGKEHCVIKVPNGNKFLVEENSDVGEISAGDFVLVEQKNLTIVDKVSSSDKYNVEKFVIVEKPTVTWDDIGGLDHQKKEIKEVIELPLTKPDVFKDVGITPPKGLLLHGPSGTGKTLLAKSVANSTNSTFIEVVGSELVQKFIGEGAKLVKEIFEMAKKKAPSIVFIDELDSLAAKRVDIGTSGEREVQRTFMQLLAEIDGFKRLGDVKIIGCTNRKDILDPAVLRPGRLDRLIEVGIPEGEGIGEIFDIHTESMTLDKDLDRKKVFKKLEGFSGAEIKAVCTEAGYFAIRNDRSTVKQEDFFHAVDKVKQEENLEGEDYMKMFG